MLGTCVIGFVSTATLMQTCIVKEIMTRAYYDAVI